MAEAKVIFTDTGEDSLTIFTEIAGMEKMGDAVSPAMAIAMATRAMFENGMLAEAAAIALAGLSEGKVPSECILDHYTKSKKRTPDNDGGI